MELEVIFLSPQDHKSGPKWQLQTMPKIKTTSKGPLKSTSRIQHPEGEARPKPWTLDRDHKHTPRPPPPQPRKGQGQQVIRGIFRTQPNNFDGALSKIAKKLLTTFAPSMMLNPALNMPMVMILREALSLTGSKCRHELIHH